MKSKSIGVFDSGLGGLTVVKELIKLLPNENIIYFGDTGRVPYGSRSDNTILKYALQDISFLKSNNVKIIVAACGTVSSIFFNNMIDSHSFSDFYYTGVLMPTAKKAAEISKNGRIGIIGTPATIKSKAYQSCLLSINPELQLASASCPLFVPLVENGIFNSDNIIVQSTVKMYLESIKKADIDTLILGCTHYPILEKAISNFMDTSIALVNPGIQTAEFVKNYLSTHNLLTDSSLTGKCSFFVSDNIDNFESITGIFLGKNNHNFSLVNVDDINNLEIEYISRC